MSQRLLSSLKHSKSQRVLRSLKNEIDGTMGIKTRVDNEYSALGFALARQRKAGERPDLTGLGKIATLERFAAAIKDLQDNWPDWSVDERVGFIQAKVNDELTDADVPKLHGFDTEEEDSIGRFYHFKWKISINEELVRSDALSDAGAAGLCNTMMHEARHAEQIFLAARYIVWDSGGISVEDLASIVKIPIVIAEAAVTAKFNDDTEEGGLLGQNMAIAYVAKGEENKKISGDSSSANLKVSTALDKAKEAEKALRANRTDARIADATTKRDKLKAAIAKAERSYRQYRNIPYEADAHDVGDAAELAFKEWV